MYEDIAELILSMPNASTPRSQLGTALPSKRSMLIQLRVSFSIKSSNRVQRNCRFAIVNNT